jgi:putative ABC transport system permease protein
LSIVLIINPQSLIVEGGERKMKNVFKIAWRNLFRYQRRTILTGTLIAIGVIFMIVFSGVGNSFKEQVTGELTNANLGDLQIHAAGFLESIDSNPLEMTLGGEELQQIEQMLNENEQIEAYSKRIRFGGMLSNYEETVSMRLTAIIPEMENETCPGLPKRILNRTSEDPQFLKPGEILVPENIAKGLNLEVGSDVVLVATNKDGSVNGMSFRVGGISENLFGPTGRDAYLHLEDARTLLRIEGQEILEIAIKLKHFNTLKSVSQDLNAAVSWMLTSEGQPIAEVHTWEQLTPFKSVANMIDLLITMIRVVLIAIVLISVMNVMLMSVYERISEIGTIASIGTPPKRILSLFLLEGLSLGLISSIAGSILGMGVLLYLNVTTFQFKMGMIEMTLAPDIPLMDVLMTLVLVVLISVVSGFQPALKASRLEPVEALRHV